MSGPIIMDFVTDPEELAHAGKQRKQFDRNLAWLATNAANVYRLHRGKVICIAGEQLFVADTVREVIAQAAAAHPEDEGRFVRYIPIENAARIYAN